MKLDDLNIIEILNKSMGLVFSNMDSFSPDFKAGIASCFNHPSPVTKIKDVAECLYSQKDKLNNDLRELVAQCFTVMDNHGFEASERCNGIIAAMKRDAGIKGNWPKAESDPYPISKYGTPKNILEPKNISDI